MLKTQTTREDRWNGKERSSNEANESDRKQQNQTEQERYRTPDESTPPGDSGVSPEKSRTEARQTSQPHLTVLHHPLHN